MNKVYKKFLAGLLISSLFLVNGCFLTDWVDDQLGDEDLDSVITSDEVIIKTADQDYTFTVEVADTSAERREGLMGRESLADDYGMMFVFPDERTRSFWMKDTLIYLDIIFISADKKIVDIKEDFEPCYDGDNCTDYRSRREAKYALEVNAGTVLGKAIQIGDEVEFDF